MALGCFVCVEIVLAKGGQGGEQRERSCLGCCFEGSREGGQVDVYLDIAMRGGIHPDWPFSIISQNGNDATGEVPGTGLRLSRGFVPIETHSRDCFKRVLIDS